MSFPGFRPRRLRHTAAIRRMVSETTLSVDDFIYPLFIKHGTGERSPIVSMPGVFQLTVDQAVEEARTASAAGIPAVILFGLPAAKDSVGLENFAADGIIQQAVRAIKAALPDLVVITDVCLCEYTDHGHCGVLNVADVQKETGRPYRSLPEGFVLNDETLELLGQISVSHADAGADIIAPSGMMDGMVAAIRSALDARTYFHIPIMSYSVKYASGFYGPFRDAADGAPKFGDRRSHQMDPGNAAEALKEVDLDVSEGADFLMVKPALSYLDVIRRVKDRYPEIPLAAYNVSGEFAMVKAAAANGWLDEKVAALEILKSIKRAGADLIITYHAVDAARWLAA